VRSRAPQAIKYNTNLTALLLTGSIRWLGQVLTGAELHCIATALDCPVRSVGPPEPGPQSARL
jgi:hypothetical protein